LCVGSLIYFRILGNETSANSLVMECQLTENNAMVRLYEVRGSSVTTSDSWSVTYQEPSFAKSHLKTPEYWDEVSDWKYIMRN